MKTFDRLLQIVDDGSESNLKKFLNETENICKKYDHLKDQEWMLKTSKWLSVFNDVHPCDNKNLPPLRLELRWRDQFYKQKNQITGKEEKNNVKDLGLVIKFGGMSQFKVFESSITSDLVEHTKLRTDSNMYFVGLVMMYQMKIPFFLTYKDNYREINIPKSKKDIPFALLDIMTDEDKDKLHE